MPTAKNEVKLKFGDKAKYASAIKNADTVYFITDTNQIFVGSSLVSSKCYYVTSEPSASNYGVGDIVVWKISENNAKICIVNSSGEFDILSISIPTELKNPNALTFTGAVTGTYDGSAVKTVNIPAAITVDSSLSNTSTNPVQNKVIVNKFKSIIIDAEISSGALIVNRSWTIKAIDDFYNDMFQGYKFIYMIINNRDKNNELIYLPINVIAPLAAKPIVYFSAQKDDNTIIIVKGEATSVTSTVTWTYEEKMILPVCSTSDNGKFLQAVNGVPTWVALTNVAEEGA